MKKLKWVAGLAALSAAAVLTAPAQAFNIGFDEGAVAQTGTMSYDGAGGALQGRDLLYTTILGTDTPANSGGILVCRGCFLNFDTGANIAEGPTEWTWGPGGSFVLTGSVVTLGGDVLISDEVILSGSFRGRSNMTGGGGNGLFVALGTDEKHVALTDYYGIPQDTSWQFAHTDLALASCDEPGDGAINCNVLNSDLNNIKVPVPAPLALLGIGLLGLGASRRK